MATLHEGSTFVARVEEPLNVAMTIDTISMFRFNDALGYRHAAGVIFGERGNKK